jgi:peroxiredoxin (alkyl hydroperoxide reductase subunit C)
MNEGGITMNTASTEGPPEVRLPRLNEPAPDFEAQSTHGPIKFSDFAKGKWVVLFSHPADFTPVCTTELVQFARRKPEFDKLGVQLLGLSVDSIYSHIAWTRNMEEKFGQEITYPMIADLDMKVAQKYGMIHPGASTTATVRCVFVIDDQRNVRAMVYYPLTNGRSVDEIMRLVQSLQTSTKNGVATPEGWKPGEDVIVPAPVTAEGAKSRVGKEKGGLSDQKDWYFSKKKLG